MSIVWIRIKWQFHINGFTLRLALNKWLVATIPPRKKWKEKENEEMIVAGNAIYAIAQRNLKKIQDFNGVWTVVQFWVKSIVFILPVAAKHWTGFPRSQFRPHPYLLSLKPQWWADQVPWTALSTHQAFLQCLSWVCSKELLLACKTIHNINKNIQGNLVFKYSLQQ